MTIVIDSLDFHSIFATVNVCGNDWLNEEYYLVYLRSLMPTLEPRDTLKKSLVFNPLTKTSTFYVGLCILWTCIHAENSSHTFCTCMRCWWDNSLDQGHHNKAPVVRMVRYDAPHIDEHYICGSAPSSGMSWKNICTTKIPPSISQLRIIPLNPTRPHLLSSCLNQVCFVTSHDYLCTNPGRVPHPAT